MSKFNEIYEIGDRVCVTSDKLGMGTVIGFGNNGYSIQIETDDGSGDKISLSGKRYHQFGELDSLHLVGRNKKKPPKELKSAQQLTVKGHTPKLIIKIGCKDFAYETAEKLAHKLLKLAKAKKDVESPVALSYDGESFSVEDIENFLKWFKQVKGGK